MLVAWWEREQVGNLCTRAHTLMSEQGHAQIGLCAPTQRQQPRLCMYAGANCCCQPHMQTGHTTHTTLVAPFVHACRHQLPPLLAPHAYTNGLCSRHGTSGLFEHACMCQLPPLLVPCTYTNRLYNPRVLVAPFVPVYRLQPPPLLAPCTHANKSAGSRASGRVENYTF